MDAKLLTDTFVRCGSKKAAVIEQNEIVVSTEFRKICESRQCGSYDKCWMCPPEIGRIEDLIAQVRSFPYAVLYQTIGTLEDSYDIEGMFAAGHIHALTSQRIQDAAKQLFHQPFLHLTCGGCHLCEVCAKVVNEPCRQPERALSSLEGYGIDVYNTTKNTDLKYTNGPNTVTYFGMVLFGE